ncbi:DNA-binding protein RFX5 isoform X2 [Electrophorus electricus]|uniref:DNA-binding protein RFX5 isoform X2 n=1 Tax=Electrophorus electricus TaxID=8005 RepID=UPI0015CFDBF7|nr:DNA-binding protein RFX5 isoform X2 [Electrophorus electricus]
MMEDRLKTDTSSGEGDTEPSMLLQKLKSNISKSVQNKVDTILRDVQQFSDNDKLYLYLQLPSSPSVGEKSDSNSVNTADQLHTCSWIRSHLEEHADTCLPKQDVYETYRKHCENLQQRPLSAANFGKIIRDIFPNIKARRLGGRGQSKYCYSGIRRKTVLNMPLLPNLDLKNDPSELTELVQTYKQEVTEAACELICDWAQKILKRSFDTVVEIARFLVQEHIVNPRCSQAELVTSAALAGGPAKPHKVIKKTPVTPRAGGAEEDSSSQDAKQKDKDGTEQGSPNKLPQSDKPAKVMDPSRPGCRDQQVEALMKKLHPLLPKDGSVQDKSQLSMHSSPPAFTPNDSSSVKMTVPMVPVMILSYPDKNTSVTASTSAAPTPVVQRARTAPPKRGFDTPAVPARPGTATAAPAPPLKRKRGRPRKPRPEELAATTATTAVVTQGPNPTLLTRGVIQKALSSTMPAPSSQVMEIVLQDQRSLLLSPQEVADTECRGVMVKCQPAADAPPETRPILLLQGDGQPTYEVSRAMVIQRAPLSREGRPTDLPATQTTTSHLPPATLHEDRGEVEITLTPVEPHVDPLLTAATMFGPRAGEGPQPEGL